MEGVIDLRRRPKHLGVAPGTGFEGLDERQWNLLELWLIELIA